MLSRPMPFRSVPCRVWLAHEAERDAYGNRSVTYAEEPDIETRCCYAPGRSRPDTEDDPDNGRPHGAIVTLTFYLPKDVDADLRLARIAAYPTDDATLYGRLFDVVGEPYSYPRMNVPGDYSWSVEGVAHLG